MTIADLRKGGLDAGENVIIRFQVKRPPEFAVYYSVERVVVSFADDPVLAAKQRGDLAQIAPVRGEINGLLDDWRSAKALPGGCLWPGQSDEQALKKRAMAERFDQRVADALVVALNGDVTGAGAVLDDIKQDIMAYRAGIARLQALAAAAAAVLGFIVLSTIVGLTGTLTDGVCPTDANPICFPQGTQLWRGALTGAFGALFSLALGIRRKEVPPDLNFWSNVTEATLRILIGIIAGTVLVGLILSGFVHIGFGNANPQNASALYFAAAGFLAGFTERLVPDLLAKGQVSDGAAPPPLRQSSPKTADPSGANPGGGGGGSASSDAKAAADAVADVDHAPEQSGEDGCVCDHELAEDELTDDAFLPVASGGVEAAGGEVRP